MDNNPPPLEASPAAEALDAVVSSNSELVQRQRTARPYIEKLGLSLPVTVKDVKQAFFKQARQSHPDHQGEPSEFREVQEAFEKAIVYAERNGKRLPWIGAQVPIYVAQLDALDHVESWGGRVVVEKLEWLEDTVGEDFALVADRLTEIDLTDCNVSDEQFAELAQHVEQLPYLEKLLLSGTRIGDASLLPFAQAVRLQHVDLRDTKVSFWLRKRFAKIPGMVSVLGTSRVAEFFSRR